MNIQQLLFLKTVQECVQACGGNKAEAARRLHLPRSTVFHILKRGDDFYQKRKQIEELKSKASVPATTPATTDPNAVQYWLEGSAPSSAPKEETHPQVESKENKEGESYSRTENDDSLTLIYKGARISTADELLEDGHIDLEIWQVDKIEEREWEVTGRAKQGQEVATVDGKEQLKWMPDLLWKSKNKYIFVRLTRKVPKVIGDTLEKFLKTFSWPSPPAEERHLIQNLSGAYLAEVSIYDFHLGSLCWGVESGDNYDLAIATEAYNEAIHKLVKQLSMFEIQKIVLPIGNDFFHSNDWEGKTASGTELDVVDERFAKVFECGIWCVSNAVTALLSELRCNVHVLFVPGNHDRHSSWFLSKVIEALYQDYANVTVDTKPIARKYLRHGNVLLGYTHGSSGSKFMDGLPLLMATEVPADWAECGEKAWRIGHLHRKRQGVVMSCDTFAGVTVQFMPTLAGTDKWHYDHGYVGNSKAAEAWLWNKEGYAGHFNATINRNLYKR